MTVLYSVVHLIAHSYYNICYIYYSKRYYRRQEIFKEYFHILFGFGLFFFSFPIGDKAPSTLLGLLSANTSYSNNILYNSNLILINI